jgi:hypothetical protein
MVYEKIEIINEAKAKQLQESSNLLNALVETGEVLEHIVKIIEETPNDMDIGKKIRQFIKR